MLGARDARGAGALSMSCSLRSCSVLCDKTRSEEHCPEAARCGHPLLQTASLLTPRDANDARSGWILQLCSTRAAASLAAHWVPASVRLSTSIFQAVAGAFWSCCVMAQWQYSKIGPDQQQG